MPNRHQDRGLNMRDGKIIILADGDPDGSNISALILGALTYPVPEIIAAGKVYEGIAPLYKQDGQFIWNDDDLGRPKPFKEGTKVSDRCLRTISMIRARSASASTPSDHSPEEGAERLVS